MRRFFCGYCSRSTARPFRLALGHRADYLGCSPGFFSPAPIFAASSLGLEFLPKLEEGNFWIRATLPRSISLEEANPYVNRMREIIASYPEMRTVVSQHGRPADGTDAAGFNNAEFYVPLLPKDQWPAGIGKEALTKALSDRLEVGVSRRRVQFLAKHSGQYRGGCLGRQRRELRQDLRLGS